MPIYEYKCEKGHVFDVIQKFIDEPLTECRECGAPATRVLHSPAIHFKGSGFHNTDYGRKEGPPAGAGASSDGGETNSADNGGSTSGESSAADSKPESAPSDSKTKATAD